MSCCFFSRFLSLSSCSLQLCILFYLVANSDSLLFKVFCEWGRVGLGCVPRYICGVPREGIFWGLALYLHRWC